MSRRIGFLATLAAREVWTRRVQGDNTLHMRVGVPGLVNTSLTPSVLEKMMDKPRRAVSV